ncbi:MULTISPECIES: FadR/GntR family transcriptional regulator [Actinopolyspora]|uniref:DNA-binding transcriptional regulator, FadR family n=1 Tax=Actinopolyspora saharensis TaxID=995062 RepID=A0A1H0ZEI0_9ACTN|nr:MULTISPECIES: FCD domain-containing protein [Actinopolyspora]NHD15847.1 FadR family transcriptional regulator [Actinopolyspora sp. BKK2]NHE74939.1 FadR family transcriptional regulator [Actinopolyspora sp. BKK1]SDQ25566.1 DNA-binding transcriptional regulator, FadR family [Actinopolyspora saharensis]
MATAAPRAWERVLARIESDLLDGRLTPGQRIPGERALAGELNVGRSSVREAMRVLEALGVLRAQTGSGPEAGAIILTRPTGGMSALMRLQVAGRGFPVPDVVRTRVILETSSVSELAARTEPVDLSEVDGLLDAMDAPELSRQEFLVLDAQFHLALTRAAGNQVVTAMMSGLRDSIETYTGRIAAALDSWEDTANRLRAEHRAIAAAVRDGTADLAGERVAAHIRGYYAAATPEE